MPVVIYEKWRDEQAKALYPFVDTATLTSLENFEVPRDLFLDAAFYGANLANPTWISEIEVGYDVMRVTVASNDNVIGSGSWSPGSGTDVIAIVDRADRPVGTLVVNQVVGNDFVAVNRGQLLAFANDATPFVVAAVYFFNDGVDARTTEGAPLDEQGDVYMVGINGVQLEVLSGDEYVDAAGQPITVIVINAVGDPLAARATCDNFVAPRPITQVVFQRSDVTHSCNPSGLGDVWIMPASKVDAEPALRVTTVENGIVISLFGSQSTDVK